jgi:hypothetical protein
VQDSCCGALVVTFAPWHVSSTTYLHIKFIASSFCVALVNLCVVLQVEEFELPKASTVCSLVILSYFLVTAGIAYDIINEPPAIGGEQDPVTGAALIWLHVLLKAVLFTAAAGALRLCRMQP